MRRMIWTVVLATMCGSASAAAEPMKTPKPKPKVDIPEGQQVTFISPEYASQRWAGFKGTVESNPSYEICRSQQDVRIDGDWEKLLNEVRDSHWVMAYGDYLRELGYAMPRIGITWENFSAT